MLSRLMTSKFPLLVVLGELAVQLRERDLHLDLEWVPRLQNEEADALTNGDFGGFDPRRRVEVDPTTLDFRVLPGLLRAAENLYKDISERRQRGSGQQTAGRQGKRKLRERDPWQ